MSLHIAISGLTSLQRTLFIAKKSDSKRKEVVEYEQNMYKKRHSPVLYFLLSPTANFLIISFKILEFPMDQAIIFE